MRGDGKIPAAPRAAPAVRAPLKARSPSVEAIEKLRALVFPSAARRGSSIAPAAFTGTSRHIAERSTVSRAPGASPSMRPSRLSITVSSLRRRLVTRITPFAMLTPPSGANRLIDIAAPAGSRLATNGGRSRSNRIVGAVRVTRAGANPAEREFGQGEIDPRYRRGQDVFARIVVEPRVDQPEARPWENAERGRLGRAPGQGGRRAQRRS